ncbi:PP2C family protein-serine/threonine phosphatase [Acanthopleuribacter pedis]|uniref:Serine/threonine-protein phosphatase n=1 Tax=Acanthopleuribacter pedis TaxID=442870 RepID=A0A8J7QJC7_9BACT|nr:protein phosphatase 2C domain-containing protein [Acanthopleuribacter pedis]MBO1321896.1 serine/threonine-protein phosphatase [Acanthopleuribacter pedis]
MTPFHRLLPKIKTWTPPELTLHAGWASFVGNRQKNEDVALCLSEPRIFAVADGMGGHAHGAFAAKTTVEHFAKWMLHAHARNWSWPRAWGQRPNTGNEPLMRCILARALAQANEEVLRHIECNVAYAGMGSTFSGGVFYRHAFHWIHVGDTRIYRLRGGQITRLTKDQNYRELIRASGRPDSADQLAQFGRRLTRHVGMEGLLPEQGCEPCAPGDTFLICSDGLYETLGPIRVCAILADATRMPERQAEQFMMKAKDAKASDNATAVVIQL